LEECWRAGSKVEEPTCVCDNFKITQDFGIQEGIIIYPRTTTGLYKIVAINDISPWGKDYIVCSDTTLISQIKFKQIKDSAIIKFTGGTIIDSPCVSFLNGGTVDPFPIIRVKTIDLK
jgi:hypothetical protein